MPIPAAIMAAPAIAGLIGKIFGAANQGSGVQNYNENLQRQQHAQAANADTLSRASLINSNSTNRAAMQNADTYNRAGLDLQRKQFTQNEPSAQARQAMAGSMLQRIQPLSMSGGNAQLQANMPQMSSIIDSIGPEARQAGGLLAQRGLSGLQAGPSKFADMAPVSLPDVLNLPPAMQAKLQQSGLLEKILGVGGLIASSVGAIGDLTSLGQKPTEFDGELGY